jgi:hypothetical protein
MNKNNSTMNYILLVTSIILLVSILIIAAFIINNTEEPTSKDQGQEEKLFINDTITPPGLRQAVAVEVQRIHKRGIESVMRTRGTKWKQNPTYSFTIQLHDANWESNIITTWDTGYIGWETYRYVENQTPEVSVIFNMYDHEKKLFGESKTQSDRFMVTYDFRTGRWTGDDSFNDSDGYGHFVGSEYEIWFNIYQTDNDNDNIPFWTEQNILNTDPYRDDSLCDPDQDGIPTSWEWKWGYDPFKFDNHTILDPDHDGLENTEEYLMRKWLANPFSKQIYLEVDFMEKEPGLFTKDHILHKESQWLLMDAFTDHQITVHIDDGWPSGYTNGGGELLPFTEDYIGPFSGMASGYYKYHFPDERKGIFRYVLVLYDCGWNFCQDHKLWPDVITIPDNNGYFNRVYIPPAATERLRRLAHGVVLMHELGHSLGLVPSYCEGIDNASHAGRNNLPPIQKLIERINSWKYWWDYQSVMNYQKLNMYLLDYSDGSHGPRDMDDWSYIDLTFFQRPINEDYDISYS